MAHLRQHELGNNLGECAYAFTTFWSKSFLDTIVSRYQGTPSCNQQTIKQAIEVKQNPAKYTKKPLKRTKLKCRCIMSSLFRNNESILLMFCLLFFFLFLLLCGSIVIPELKVSGINKANKEVAHNSFTSSDSFISQVVAFIGLLNFWNLFAYVKKY